MKKDDDNSAKKETQGMTVRKSGNFSEWYNEAVLKAKLAGFAPVGGCMIIRPYGYAIWERIQSALDTSLKKSGHRNAYFPMFIPEKFLHKEAEHFEGFVPEVAWVEEENERYALRPTSETIICDAYSKWIRSWRDLPVLVNQWCNIVRWETKVTKLFLRTREFLWQEGHTAHATKEEADAEVMKILDFYVDLAQNHLAIPVLSGRKSDSEKFAGALYTTTMEGLMPDGRALQMGTSHNLGQNFSKAFDIKFLDKDGKEKNVWQTSWGVSTRLIGAVAMVHGDDRGLVLPPRIAPVQVVIIPIIFEEGKGAVLDACKKVKERLGKDFMVELDDNDAYSAGWKFNEWELRGVPIRIEIGPRDVRNGEAVLVRRDTGEKTAVKLGGLEKAVKDMLDSIQNNLFKKAKKFLDDNTVSASSYEKLREAIGKRKMARASWCGSPDCEEKMKGETTATIRVMNPLGKKGAGSGKAKCVCCGKAAKHIVYIAKAY